MRPLSLLLHVLAYIAIATANDSQSMPSIPACARSCLTTSIAASSCATTDQACICKDAQLQSNIEECVIRSCTLRQGLSVKNITSTACGAPLRIKGNEIRVSNIVLFVITAACVLLRLAHKGVFSTSELGWDDFIIVAALLSGLPSVIILDRGAIPSGLGRDVWTVPFDHITSFVHFVFTLEVLYFLQAALIKLSLLAFLLRIFPKPSTRRILWATVAFTIAWGLAFILVGIFQCRPISFFWTSWDHEGPGTCMNTNLLNWTNAIIGIAIDIWMLALPLYEVFRIQLSWRKKFSVAVMFFVGTFVTVVSGFRLKSLVHFATSHNPTWDSTDIIWWSNIEQNVGIICACMPALRIMLVRMFPNMLGSRRETTQRYDSRYGSRRIGYGRGASALSGPSIQEIVVPKDIHTITFTKTFDVQHQNVYGDERALFEMNVFHGERTTPARSSNTSELSL
ncbi:hypothetical protein EK21DRAFT_74877 [Setomelanomma holmii]|uniref:CFEM domain-containing protein n=1 Tax=Setomelanomma holmii TaxID=210430 RepID=A0A9P4H2Y4_9PLEO|nr:hypothetical protein EK21DRAFT_74877 [Setomelanomma holmii]